MYGNRAACNMRMGLFEDAVKDCHKSIANDSEYGRAYLRRARALKVIDCQYAQYKVTCISLACAGNGRIFASDFRLQEIFR